MTPSVPFLDQFPGWLLILVAIVMTLFGGGLIGVLMYLRYRRRNRRIGTREYRFPRRRDDYWPWILLVGVLLSGCMERAVIVPPTVPVRLAEQLFGVSVWVKDTNGKEVKARADLFPGMIIATDPKDFPTATRARFMNLRRDE